MKKILLCVIVAAMFAAVPVNLEAGWMRNYPYSDWSSGHFVRPTSDGNYIVAGAYDYSYPWLLKIDGNGDTLWTRILEEDKGSVFCVQETDDEGYILTGWANGGVWLIKTDPLGNTMWAKTYGNEGDDLGRFVEQTDDGGFFIVGQKGGGYANVWILKTDSLGDTLWTRDYGHRYGLYPVDKGLCGRQTADGGYIVTALTRSFAHRQGDCDLWLLKTDSLGDTLWTRVFDEAEPSASTLYDVAGYSVEPTLDGGYFIVGRTKVTEESYPNLLLLKTDEDGEIVWTRSYGGRQHNDAACWGEQTDDGGYIVAGTTYGSEPLDIWLLKVDGNGDTLWTRTYGDTISYNDFGNSLCQSPDGGYVIAGRTDHRVDGNNLLLIKTDSLGYVTVKENPIQDVGNIELINPIGHHITLRYSNHPQGFRAAIFDASGRRVDELHAPLPAGTISWGRGFGRGVYFIRDMSSASGTVHKVVLTR